MVSSKIRIKGYGYHNPTAHKNRSPEVKIQLCKNRIKFLDHTINCYNREIEELERFIKYLRDCLEDNKNNKFNNK